jgi:hypothetical protein
MHGNRKARAGYQEVFCGEEKWSELLPYYRGILYGKGMMSKGSTGKDQGRIAPELVDRVLSNDGKLPLSDVLRNRVRYFTAGTAIGSDAFLTSVGGQWSERHGLDRKRHAYPMRCAEWGGLRSFRNLQVDPVELTSLN